MKVTQIYNACCIYEHQGFKLACDPWLTDGAFEGSWYHYPSLTTTFNDINKCDAIYISHLHPDHFDVEVMSSINREKPIVILDHGGNFLKKNLKLLGFNNLIEIKDGETKKVGPFDLTMFAPFCKHPWDESQIGNLIDSALVIESHAWRILNLNDNCPDLKSAQMLKDRFKQFTLVQIKYNGAGAYPSCFTNLFSKQEMIDERNKLLNRFRDLMKKTVDILDPFFIQPFAGDYVLGGKESYKNPYITVTEKEDLIGFLIPLN